MAKVPLIFLYEVVYSKIMFSELKFSYTERYSIALFAQKFQTGFSRHWENFFEIFQCRSNHD